MIINYKNMATSKVTINSVFLIIQSMKKMLLNPVFICVEVSFILRESGNLFEVFEAIYERLFCLRSVFRRADLILAKML